MRGLESRSDIHFIRYPDQPVPDLSGHILLSLDAPPLSIDDRDHPLLLIDATWRLAPHITRGLSHELAQTIPRSIPPGFVTAYPRCQTACPDPNAGLASVEALYLAYRITNRDTTGLLDHYRWGDAFFHKNRIHR